MCQSWKSMKKLHSCTEKHYNWISPIHIPNITPFVQMVVILTTLFHFWMRWSFFFHFQFSITADHNSKPKVQMGIGQLIKSDLPLTIAPCDHTDMHTFYNVLSSIGLARNINSIKHIHKVYIHTRKKYSGEHVFAYRYTVLHHEFN